MVPQYILLIILSWNLLFFLQSNHVSAGVPAIIVFGDSTVDPGNNNDILLTTVKSNFKPYGRDFYDSEPTGRFSNGRLATDFISEIFGLPPTIPAFLDRQYSIKNFASGVSFASAGSGFDDFTATSQFVIPLGLQLEYYEQYQSMLRNSQEVENPEDIIKEALYFISLGTNDFTHYFSHENPRSVQYTISEYEDFIIDLAEGFIRDIYDLGARKLAFSGLGPFGCLPHERTTNLLHVGECKEDSNKAAQDFNAKLQSLVNSLNSELSGMRIVFLSAYDLSDSIVQNPSTYGFTNSVLGCCGSGRIEAAVLCNSLSPFTCSDANEYVFWDSYHPTQKMYQIIADHFYDSALRTFL